jgi:hypothetical protein
VLNPKMINPMVTQHILRGGGASGRTEATS